MPVTRKLLESIKSSLKTLKTPKFESDDEELAKAKLVDETLSDKEYELVGVYTDEHGMEKKDIIKIFKDKADVDKYMDENEEELKSKNYDRIILENKSVKQEAKSGEETEADVIADTKVIADEACRKMKNGTDDYFIYNDDINIYLHRNEDGTFNIEFSFIVIHYVDTGLDNIAPEDLAHILARLIKVIYYDADIELTEAKFKEKFEKSKNDLNESSVIYTNLDVEHMGDELDKHYAQTPNAKNYIQKSLDYHLQHNYISQNEYDKLREKYLAEAKSEIKNEVKTFTKDYVNKEGDTTKFRIYSFTEDDVKFVQDLVGAECIVYTEKQKDPFAGDYLYIKGKTNDYIRNEVYGTDKLAKAIEEHIKSEYPDARFDCNNTRNAYWINYNTEYNVNWSNSIVDKDSKTEAKFKDKVKAIKRSLKKNDKRLSDETAQASAERIAGSMIKNESSDDTISNSGRSTIEVHTDMLPIINMYQYDFFQLDLIDLKRDEIDELQLEFAEPKIEEEIKGVLPSASITFGEFSHPQYYRLFSNLNDILDFNVDYDVAEYEALKEKALQDSAFEKYLKDHYSSYDGFVSFFANNIKDFNEQEDWKQWVSVVSFYLPNDEEQNTEEMHNYVYDGLYETHDTLYGAIDNMYEDIKDNNIDISKEAITKYIKDYYGDIDDLDYIIDGVLAEFHLTENKKNACVGIKCCKKSKVMKEAMNKSDAPMWTADNEERFYKDIPEIEIKDVKLSGQSNGIIARMTIGTDFGYMPFDLLLINGEYRIISSADQNIINKVVEKYGMDNLIDFATGVVEMYKNTSSSTKTESSLKNEPDKNESTIIELFDIMQDNTNIDADKWNESSREARDAMIRPGLEKFYSEHKEDLDNNWDDFMDYCTDKNFHTEVRLLTDIRNNTKKNEGLFGQSKAEIDAIKKDAMEKGLYTENCKFENRAFKRNK